MPFRAEGLIDPSVLQGKKIFLAGCGSVGSAVLENLPYQFGSTVVSDEEVLEEVNIERHLLGRSELGKPKAEGCGRWLEDRGITPETIITHYGDTREILDMHKDADIFLVCIGEEAIEREINSWIVAHNKAAIYGSIFAKGAAGRIIVLPKPREVCYVCARLSDSRPTESKLEYGLDPMTAGINTTKQQPTPALRWCVSMVASYMAKTALDMLQGGDVPSKVVVQAHQYKPGLFFGFNEELGNDKWALMQSSQTGLGLEPSVEFLPIEGGWELSLHDHVYTYRTEQWNGCSLHSSKVSLEDI